MTLPVGAATATITVGAAMAHDGAAGTLVSLQVWPEVPAGLVWAADGTMIEPWSAVGTAGTLTILADQPGVLTSGTVDGTPALVAITGWPLVATWVTLLGLGAPTKHARRFAAPAPGTTVDLDLLPQDGALPVAAITYAQSLTVGGTGGAVDSVNGQMGAVVLDAAAVGAQPAGSYAAALGADDNYVTAAEKAALHTHPAVVAAGADAAAARAAIGAGTSSLVIGTGAGDAKAGDYAPDLSGLAPASGQFATLALTAAASVTLSASYPAQSLTMTSATTLIAPTVTDGHAIVLWLSGAFVPTWWAGIKWAGGTPPTYASAGTLYHLVRLGAAWYASGQAYS